MFGLSEKYWFVTVWSPPETLAVTTNSGLVPSVSSRSTHAEARSARSLCLSLALSRSRALGALRPFDYRPVARTRHVAEKGRQALRDGPLRARHGARKRRHLPRAEPVGKADAKRVVQRVAHERRREGVRITELRGDAAERVGVEDAKEHRGRGVGVGHCGHVVCLVACHRDGLLRPNQDCPNTMAFTPRATKLPMAPPPATPHPALDDDDVLDCVAAWAAAHDLVGACAVNARWRARFGPP